MYVCMYVCIYIYIYVYIPEPLHRPARGVVFAVFAVSTGAHAGHADRRSHDGDMT